MITRRRVITLSVLLCALLILPIARPYAFAAGEVRHYHITSKLLASAGEAAERELSIYLPERYDTTELAYPVVYLIHGFSGTNRTFLGAGYGGTMSDVRVDLIADRLIESGEIKPLIIVLPNMNRSWTRKEEGITPYDDYLVHEIVPFVDSNFRTIPRREGRAITGHSLGGHDALFIALQHPDMFSLAGGLSSGYPGGSLPGRDLVGNHDQASFPLHFWLYAGTNDQFALAPLNRDFVALLKEFGLPYVYEEDEGDHFNRIAQRLSENLEYFSGFLPGGIVPVAFHSALFTTWGRLRTTQLSRR